MIHPEYEVLGADAAAQAESSLTPFYPTTEGVHQLSVRKLVTQALDRIWRVSRVAAGRTARRTETAGLAGSVAVCASTAAQADVLELEQGRHPAQRRLVFESCSPIT